MDKSVVSVVASLLRDLAAVGLTPAVGVYDLAARRWVMRGGCAAPRDFGDEGLVLTLPGSAHLLEATSDGRPDLTELVSQVQEWAMDQLGHAWPERRTADGTFLEVLEPITADGAVVWAGHGSPVVPVGGLVSMK